MRVYLVSAADWLLFELIVSDGTSLYSTVGSPSMDSSKTDSMFTIKLLLIQIQDTASTYTLTIKMQLPTKSSF